jgi:colicin import membrane protein
MAADLVAQGRQRYEVAEAMRGPSLARDARRDASAAEKRALEAEKATEAACERGTTNERLVRKLMSENDSLRRTAGEGLSHVSMKRKLNVLEGDNTELRDACKDHESRNMSSAKQIASLKAQLLAIEVNNARVGSAREQAALFAREAEARGAAGVAAEQAREEDRQAREEAWKAREAAGQAREEAEQLLRAAAEQACAAAEQALTGVELARAVAERGLTQMASDLAAEKAAHLLASAGYALG